MEFFKNYNSIVFVFVFVISKIQNEIGQSITHDPCNGIPVIGADGRPILLPYEFWWTRSMEGLLQHNSCLSKNHYQQLLF